MTMNVTAPPSRSGGSRGAKFVKSTGGTAVRVSPGKGGVNIGSPRCSPAHRAASNVRTSAHCGKS